ncbi:AAA family ATPase, partial [Metamycoplasma alkalescens]
DLNPVSLNKYEGISITFKNNLFADSKIVFEEQDYQLSLIKNQVSKYPDSYLIDLSSEILPIKNKETEINKLNYLVRVLRLPIFKKLVDSKAGILVNELKEDLFFKIIKNQRINGSLFGIEEETWNEFVSIVKENYAFISDISALFKIDVSLNFYKQIAKTFQNLNEFLEEYHDNFYQYYFDADEDKKVRLTDLDKIVKNYHPEAFAYKNATYLYHYLQEYFFLSGNTRIKKELLYKILFQNNYGQELFKEINKFNAAKEELIQKVYLIELAYDDGIYYTTRDIIYMEKYVINKLIHINNLNVNFDILFEPTMNFDQTQELAIKEALAKKLLLITGNPGTGKTLITNEIIHHLLKKYDKENIAILTPTGRATININTKQNDVKAQTIHSFLQWDADENKFYINEKNPISIDCLIIDEFSMVSLELFYHLLKGLSKKSLKKIILVGDKDQLPAIGSGYLINDFIDAKIFETIFLEKIYRQAENYQIVHDALKINQGLMPFFDGSSSQFIECEPELLKKELIKKIDLLLEAGYDKKEIAVLSPIYKYQTGIDELNIELNDYFRKKENQEIITYHDKKLALNDKVINLVNDSKQKIFNGEIGYISRFVFGNLKTKKEKILTHIGVDFDQDKKSITYSRSNFFENTYPAYCTSVHKYQGSETKAVIVVLFSEAKKLLSKKLIYTAITRAKQYSVIIGEKEALEFGIKNDSDSERITNIKYLWNKRS